jgi:RNA polymerase sigma-70 factor (ECF subfamily)
MYLFLLAPRLLYPNKTGVFLSEEWNTRISLLDRAKVSTDEDAWLEFADYYRDYILMVLRKMRIRTIDIDDLAQEVLIKIWQNLGKFKVDSDRARFRTWLSTLIRNQALDQIKMAKRYKTRVDKKAEQDLVPQDEEYVTKCELDRIIESEWERHIIQLGLKNIKKLFSEQAIYVFEQSLLGKTSDELSKELDIKPNSVNKLKNRVKTRMMEEVSALRSHLGM